MNRDAIIAVIRSEETALKQVGVKSLALVGSSARDDRSEASDVDVLIHVADESGFSLMDRIGVMHLLGDALSLPVDVSRRDTLNPLVRERMVEDAIKIFLMAAPASQLYLAQMLDNIERIRLWTSGHTLETYRANLMLRDAIERCLERISEASRRLSQEVKATQPHIPWRKVADIGNVLRHEYDDVADAEVRRIVVDDLSAMRSAVQSMIDQS